ncbi:PadR family transcriptional regulator [Natronorubrum daqingense]|uniref:DNA-binding transcriptional regulator, PadR family n=1 Tax=Natronorubrum daqingense TaxID=588898 RepID=A0A1N7ESV9_9EURY|nr:hypothetical protein [Natronorubrum daqingense]APX97736.1 hypothetical protein BB347_14540 [Natronorubrum daqingense]SIR91142.1 DNA-binding transcriptional regulator, PadR family [Natronorubrum daqingense]
MEQRELASLAVLGVLAEESVATVDQIHDTLRHRHGRYWGASTGILVPTISQLEEDGHVSAVAADGSYGYEITADGRDHLQSLLDRPIDDVSHPSARSHLMVKLGFLHHLPVERRRAALRELQEQVLETRDHLLTVKSRHGEEPSESSAPPTRGSLLDLRLLILDAVLEWLEEFEVSSRTDASR